MEEFEKNPKSSKDSPKKKDNSFVFTSDQKVYWTEEQEQAVVEFLWLDETWLRNKIKWEIEDAKRERRDPNRDILNNLEELIQEVQDPEFEDRKNKIYITRLRHPMNKLVENIIFNYKLFTSDVDIKTQQHRAISFLATKFSKFRPSKNNKAFSYFGTIAKHYLIGVRKDLYNDEQRHSDFENHKEEVNQKSKFEIGDSNPLEESSSLFDHVISAIKNELIKTEMSKNDRKVGNAIIEIFETHEEHELYTKNVLYQLIKENTELQTKDITYSLGRFKTIFKLSKQEYIRKRK